MLKITAEIRPDNDKAKVGKLVVTVDDGNEASEVLTDIHCTPNEIYMVHMAETMHIVKHLYSIAEYFHNHNYPSVSNLIVKHFHKTYTPYFNPEEVVEPFKVDHKIADVLIIMA